MKTIGYLRVSTDKQDAENQRFAISQKFKCATFVSEQITSKVDWRDRKLGILIKSLESGDTLIVSELSRLGRTFYETIELLSVLSQRKINLFSIKENFELSNDIQSKVVAFAFSLASEIERGLISQRTKEALDYKRSIGVVLGRPTGSKDNKPRIRRHKNGTGKSQSV